MQRMYVCMHAKNICRYVAMHAKNVCVYIGMHALNVCSIYDYYLEGLGWMDGRAVTGNDNWSV